VLCGGSVDDQNKKLGALFEEGCLPSFLPSFLPCTVACLACSVGAIMQMFHFDGTPALDRTSSSPGWLAGWG